jgi:hypothetical protein
VDDGEPAAVDAGDVEAVRDPGRQPDDGRHGGMPGVRDRHCAAHGESEQADLGRALLERDPDRGLAVLDAEVEPLPGLDAVADFVEPKRGERRRELPDQPLEAGAPVALDLPARAAVDADDGARRALGAGPTHLRPRGKRPSMPGTRAVTRH